MNYVTDNMKIRILFFNQTKVINQWYFSKFDFNKKIVIVNHWLK